MCTPAPETVCPPSTRYCAVKGSCPANSTQKLPAVTISTGRKIVVDCFSVREPAPAP